LFSIFAFLFDLIILVKFLWVFVSKCCVIYDFLSKSIYQNNLCSSRLLKVIIVFHDRIPSYFHSRRRSRSTCSAGLKFCCKKQGAGGKLNKGATGDGRGIASTCCLCTLKPDFFFSVRL
jgi:hypothetical protein